MTITDVDPPQTLRLVSANDKLPARNARYRQAAPLYGDARSLYRQVLQASLAQQDQVQADALRVILATKQSSSAASARTFTANAIWQLMFVDVVAWCRNRQLDVPPGVAHALAATMNYLDATASFGADSDDLDSLLDAIDECTGGWLDDELSRSTASASRSGRRGSLRSPRGPKRS